MKRKLLLIPLLLILTSCGEVTEEDLIGGQWIGTAGYKDGEVEGEPDCYPMHDGLEFVDEELVRLDSHDREFEYRISNNEVGLQLDLEELAPETMFQSYGYDVEMISSDEMVLIGTFPEGNCYMERQ